MGTPPTFSCRSNIRGVCLNGTLQHVDRPCCCSGAGLRWGDECRRQQGAASGTPLKIGSRKEKAAAIPDIAKANGLPFESIQTPGSRPSDVRQKNDPVALEMIAGTARSSAGNSPLTAGLLRALNTLPLYGPQEPFTATRVFHTMMVYFNRTLPKSQSPRCHWIDADRANSTSCRKRGGQGGPATLGRSYPTRVWPPKLFSSSHRWVALPVRRLTRKVSTFPARGWSGRLSTNRQHTLAQARVRGVHCPTDTGPNPLAVSEKVHYGRGTHPGSPRGTRIMRQHSRTRPRPPHVPPGRRAGSDRGAAVRRVTGGRNPPQRHSPALPVAAEAGVLPGPDAPAVPRQAAGRHPHRRRPAALRR